MSRSAVPAAAAKRENLQCDCFVGSHETWRTLTKPRASIASYIGRPEFAVISDDNKIGRQKPDSVAYCSVRVFFVEEHRGQHVADTGIKGA